MKTREKIFIILLICAAGAVASDWDIDIMPVQQLKPGMQGVARTVFYGATIEDVGVEVIQVMHNFYPGRDVILARLLGEKAEHNGVVAGMSGSPVYINGKLVGAIAYSFGQFMKEPIAGIMPIETMFEILDKEKSRPIESSYQSETFKDYSQAVQVGADDQFWRRVLKMPDSNSPATTRLQKIKSPLVFSGFQPEALASFENIFSALGFEPMFAGGGASGDEADDAPTFEPGSAVSVVLVTGDYSIEATGTVTAVSGSKLLAFGHQLFNFGPIRLPLAGAQIYATLPSLMASTKMGTATEVVGTFLQDRMSGALGDLTVQPRMIPVHLEIESPMHDPAHFGFKMADDPAFNNMLPFYLRIALIQAMNAARLAGEQNSSFLHGAIILADGRKVELDDFFTSKQVFGFSASGSDAVAASDLVTALLGTLMVSDFKAPAIDKVELKLSTTPNAHYAMIENVWQNKTIIKAGEDLTLTIRLRDNNEKSLNVTRVVPIPENISGSRLSILISSGSSLSRYEMQVNRDKFIPKSFDHLLKIIERRRKPQNLYIQVRAMDSGLIVDGEEMQDLPPSIQNVMNTRSSGGVAKHLRDRVIYEAAVPMQDVILGAKRLTLRIEQPKSTNNNNSRNAWLN